MTNWREVVEQHGQVVWRTAYRLLGNHADASDCFQKVFLDAVQVALVEQGESASMVQPHSLFERIQAMKPITKFVTVAALFLVICGVFGVLSPRSRALALEEVAMAFESIRSATCDMTSESRDVKNQSKVMFLAPSLERIETKMGAR